MENLKTLVKWTRLGLVALFLITVAIQLSFSLMVTYYDFEVPFLIHKENMPWFNILGGAIILIEVAAGWILYRSRTNYIKVLDKLEEKLKIFGRIYFVLLLLICAGASTSLIAFAFTHELLWYFPWLICMYFIGKNFPFRLNLFHEMGIVDEEERKLFYKRKTDLD
ncbi:hypothetical protein [Marinifilum sp.]|uniref:hypothetical protein n=1 Tax=Marinifilum sp. TaxID=2033137 RepID=UPI003BAB67DE